MQLYVLVVGIYGLAPAPICSRFGTDLEDLVYQVVEIAEAREKRHGWTPKKRDINKIVDILQTKNIYDESEHEGIFIHKTIITLS